MYMYICTCIYVHYRSLAEYIYDACTDTCNMASLTHTPFPFHIHMDMYVYTIVYFISAYEKKESEIV